MAIAPWEEHFATSCYEDLQTSYVDQSSQGAAAVGQWRGSSSSSRRRWCVRSFTSTRDLSLPLQHHLSPFFVRRAKAPRPYYYTTVCKGRIQPMAHHHANILHPMDDM